MVQIPSTGKTILLGSDGAYAKKDEEFPRPTVSFTYDYAIDTNEVTQGQYQSLLGRNPVKDDKFGLGPNFPVYNVTYFDAALFCNARSKAEGLDTVYSYSNSQSDATGRTYALDGLALHFGKRGYRLPTEAEWEFAARGNIQTHFPWGNDPDTSKASQIAWYNGNAQGKTHSVGGLQPNVFGLHDMLGNVMEWVNDWKDAYVQVTFSNFLGARDPGVNAERSIKGGAFSYDFRYLRYSGRSANYPTLSSASAEYVGFRCVLGVIPQGQYLSGGAAHRATPIVTPKPSGVSSLFHHNQVKLVFVNTTPSTRTLCYIDYSENPVVVHEFLDDTLVFTPSISPDGQFVAYGNVDEGNPRVGAVHVRQLKVGSKELLLQVPSAVIPRWYVDPLSRDTFLVMASSATNNLVPTWNTSQTFRIKMSGGVAVGSPELLSSASYHDGLSNDGITLVSGFQRLRMRNLNVSGDRILFTGPKNGKPLGDTSQVCNVSIHPDFKTTPNILMLDFGYTGTSTVVGRGYGLHEILFRVDTSGSVVRWYGAPKGFVAWQDAEWSNVGAYGVATGEDQSQGYPSVLAVNLEDATTEVLATGTTLRQPGIWVKPGVVIPADTDLGVRDSMGKYDFPKNGFAQSEFSYKMPIFWLNRNSAEVACLGSSRTEMGIAPSSFHHFKTINLGFSRNGVVGISELLKNYLGNHSPQLKTVVVEVIPGWLFNPEGGVLDTWKLEMGETFGYLYDKSHKFWKDFVPNSLDSIERIQLINDAKVFGPLDSLGGYERPCNGWGPNLPQVFPTGSQSLADSFLLENINGLKIMAQEANKMGLLFVLSLFPESPRFKNTSYYGKFGPTRSIGQILVSNLHSMCDSIPNCKFYDANLEGNHDYDSTMFWNEDHLCTAGSLTLSHRLDSAITQWSSGAR